MRACHTDITMNVFHWHANNTQNYPNSAPTSIHRLGGELAKSEFTRIPNSYSLSRYLLYLKSVWLPGNGIYENYSSFSTLNVLGYIATSGLVKLAFVKSTRIQKPASPPSKLVVCAYSSHSARAVSCTPTTDQTGRLG